MGRFRRSGSRAGFPLVPLLLLLIAAVVVHNGRSSVLRTDHATGWDGYYYLVQIQSLLTEGEMHSPEYSLVYVPLLAFHFLTGDYLEAYRASSVLIGLLFVLSVFALARSLLRRAGAGRKTGDIAALLAAGLSAMSPSLYYFLTQFPKNLLGFSLLLFFISCILGPGGSWKEKGTKRRAFHAAAAALLFLAAFFTHRFSAVLAVMFLVIYFSPSAWRLLRLLWTGGIIRHGRLVLTAAAACLIIAVILMISSRIPLAPSIADLERITGDLSPVPIFVPASFMAAFGSFKITLPWMVEMYAAAAVPLLTCILLLLWRRARFLHLGRGYAATLVMALAGLFPFFRFSLEGISYRLFLGTLLLLPLVSIPYLGRAAERLTGRRTREGKEGAGLMPSLILVSMLAASLFTSRSYRPELHDPPYGYYRELAGDAMEALEDEDFELIVAHKALAEMITYTYRVDALPWSPEEYFPRDRVWRITAGIMKDEVSYYTDPELADEYYIRLRGDYGLLREDVWEDFLQGISGDPVMMEAVDTWRNPMELRPRYLVGDRSSSQ